MTRTELAHDYLCATLNNSYADAWAGTYANLVKSAFALADAFLAAAGPHEHAPQPEAPDAGVVRAWLTRDGGRHAGYVDISLKRPTCDLDDWMDGDYSMRQLADLLMPGPGGPDAICEIEIRRVPR